MAKMVYANRFIEDAQDVWSPRVRTRLEMALRMIESFPESCPHATQPTLNVRFGASIRTHSLPPFVLVYSYDAGQDVVYVRGLIPARTIS